MNKDNRHGGMKVFTIIWLGQLTSLVGTGMTTFVMTIWAWKVTGQVTPLALISVFNFGVMMTLAPIAGTLVDRWNRRRVMIFSDLAAGLTTMVILTLYATGYLQVWHLYISGAIAGGCQAFQYPAYSAAVTMMVSREQYTRANGMISLAESSSGVLAPIIAAALLLPIGFVGIMLFDIVTFIVAVTTLLLVDIPQPASTEAGRAGKGNLLQETYYGIRYIYTNHPLLGLIAVIFLGNLVSSFVVVVQNPMILARTGDNAAIMATVQSISAIGGVAAGLLMSLWGGPKRRIHGLLMGFVIGGLLGIFLLGLGRSTAVWSVRDPGPGWPSCLSSQAFCTW
jgi:MFS family permease